MEHEASSADQVLTQARAAVDAGELWRARDLLAAQVETDADPEVMALLGEVYQRMGDLPRAGAVFFAAGAKGDEADAAVAAWREQSADDFTVMWRSLPASVRVEPLPRRIAALRERALAAGGDVGGLVDGEVPDTASGVGATASEIVRPSTEVALRESPNEEGDGDEGGFDASWFVAWVLAVMFVVFAVIGFVTALGWIVPG